MCRLSLTSIAPRRHTPPCVLLVVLCIASLLDSAALAQGRRKVIIDQDGAGPGGTDMQAIAAIVNSPAAEVLGICVLTGDAWRDEEVQHTLRLLEVLGRTDIPVLPGAVFPLLNNKEFIARWETLYGKVPYQGAWNYGRPTVHGPYEVPPLAEGQPTTKPSAESAAAFLVRTVRQFPHEVTVYAAGPMTNLALAAGLDPQFPELTNELVVMGGSIRPVTDDPQFGPSARREFNFWMDPEATRMVLHARWPRVTLTTVDISVKTRMDKRLIAELTRASTPGAQYLAKYAEESYLWDEIAAVAWLDPSLITKTRRLYVDVDVDHGAGYGETLAWEPGHQPGLGEQVVDVQEDLDRERFYHTFVELLSRPASR
jgi:purine nucleosidase